MSDESMYFLKLDGVIGEGDKPNHVNEIPVLGWSWSGSSTSTVGKAGGSGAPTVTFDPINITAILDSGVAKLANFFATGKHIATGQVSCLKTGNGAKDYFTLALTEIFVQYFGLNASGGMPVVQLALTFKTVVSTYSKQATDGTLSATAPTTIDASTGVAS